MTKTCGECKNFYDYEHRKAPCCWSKPTDNACREFELKVLTKGDKLRQMSNEKLATVWSEQAFMFAWCYDCMCYCKDGDTPENRLKCKNRVLNYLNAPAESEGKMSKEYEFEWEKHTCGECTQFGDKRSCLCSRRTAEHKACASFKSPPTVFDRITASPEVLAVEFVGMMYDRVSGEDRYYSMLTGEFYNSYEEAISATVAKLKEVSNE
jgi:hypothetical protein